MQLLLIRWRSLSLTDHDYWSQCTRTEFGHVLTVPDDFVLAEPGQRGRCNRQLQCVCSAGWGNLTGHHGTGKTTCRSTGKTSSFISIIIYLLTARVVGTPQMISKLVSSIFPCSPLPSGTWRTPGLSIPWCCLSTFPSVCLVFFPLSYFLVRWFWPDLMNGRQCPYRWDF